MFPLHSCHLVTRPKCLLQGKFYEIFEMDAHVAADILNLQAMRVPPTAAPAPGLRAYTGVARWSNNEELSITPFACML